MNKILNKWQWFFKIQRNLYRMESGWYELSCGILKITSLPREGDMIGKENHDGYGIRFNFWFPFCDFSIF